MSNSRQRRTQTLGAADSASNLPEIPEQVDKQGRPLICVLDDDSPIGQAVIAELERGDFRVRTLSGQPWEHALRGVSAVVCPHPAVMDIAAAKRVEEVVEALETYSPDLRLVVVSPLGAFAARHEVLRQAADGENRVLTSSLDAVVMRVTVPHPLAHDLVTGSWARFSRALAAPVLCPVDPAFIARRVVDEAIAEEVSQPLITLAGPEVFSFADLTVLTAHIESRLPGFSLPLGQFQGLLRDLLRGASLPDDDAEIGGETYSTWVANQ